MSPRAKTATDDEVLQAAVRAILRVGPARVTLAEVAREAGLAPATLVQRFGSKRGLLLAIARQGPEANGAGFDRAREANPSPLGALIDLSLEMTRWFDSADAVAHHLAFLQMDLADPEFLALAARSSAAVRDGIRGLLDDAVDAGELVPCDTAALASLFQASYNGSLLNWAVHREGTLTAWVKRDLATLLAPYRPGRF